MTAFGYRMTRRSILIGAAASLISSPAIVQAASLMSVRGFPITIFKSGAENSEDDGRMVQIFLL